MKRKLLFLYLFTTFLFSISAQQGRRRKRIKDIRGSIVGDITGDTYSPDLSSVIPGSSTLAFVFDVTGSMWDDLKQVTAGARQILDTTRNRAEKPLHNYVLIPFHDPGKVTTKDLCSRTVSRFLKGFRKPETDFYPVDSLTGY